MYEPGRAEIDAVARVIGSGLPLLFGSARDALAVMGAHKQRVGMPPYDTGRQDVWRAS